MIYETFFIPANFTDAGRLFGFFEIRNVIEAVILGIPILYFCTFFLPFEFMTKIIVTMTIFVPAAGFALMGIADECLSRYIQAWWKWRKRKRILTFRGEVAYVEFERFYIRCKQRSGR